MEKTANDQKKTMKKRFGLWGYLFCCLGVVAALPVLVLGIIQVPRWGEIQLREVDREGEFVAKALVHGIGQIVDGHVRAVETLAGQVTVRKSFDPEVLQKMVTSARLRYGGFSFMYVAGVDGVSIAAEPRLRSSGKPTAGTNYSTRDYYKEIMRTRKTTTSRVQIGKNSGVPNIQIVAPITDSAGEMIAFAEGSLDLRSIHEMADRLTKGISGVQVAVLDHEGRVMTHPDKEVRDTVKNLSHLSLFQKVKAKGIQVRTGIDDKGVMMHASVAEVSRFATRS